ncbi:hypothetical protein PIIN_03196 [Serendipita indica DSM 11827]|uniref:Uncharacterized protein n=1 Tax=Serendipita indica (strain DSM 11827) TaxID=1109443 RepID=G4TD82_SERID|nr:hypothetical protein PIIN_03196 [Serendipita indica DSM 11827]
MDYYSNHSETTLPTSHNDTYPPQSHYMSRTTTYDSSGSSFGKKQELVSEESLHEVPQARIATDKQLTAEAPRRPWYAHLFPKSWPIRCFLAGVVLETIINLAIQGDIYSRLSAAVQAASEDEAQRYALIRVIVYLALFAFAHVFQLALAIEAVWQQNTLQFLFLTIFNLLFLVYSVIQAAEINTVQTSLQSGITAVGIKPLTIISSVVIGISELVFIATGYQIYKEFGWKVYKFLGADRQIKRIYAHYQIFLSLLRFDLFFCIGFSAQLFVFILGKDDVEYFLTIGALPLGVLILIGGHFAARYENKWLMFGFMLGCVFATVYFAYKLFRIYEGISINTMYKDITKSLNLFAAVSLLFLMVTFIWGCIVMHNFGRGLKQQMSKKHVAGHRRRNTSITLDNKAFPMTANSKRMSID